MGSTGSSGIVSTGLQQGAVGCVSGSVGGVVEAAFKGNKNNYTYKGKRYEDDEEDY